MARFLLITYALEQALMKLGLLDFEEIDPCYGLKRSVKVLKEGLPSIQAFLQDTEERVVASRFSDNFLDLQIHVEYIEYLLDELAYNDQLMYLSTADSGRLFGLTVGARIQLDLETMLDVLNKISLSLEEIRSNRQQVESSGLGVISDDVKLWEG
ncbi:hypothetical protein OIU76_023893 [Salix suchowensis]|nr:hypothetical protein OIU76_023893 [Salix suchowensis]